MTLVWLLALLFSLNPLSYAGTADDKDCIEWILGQYPSLKENTEYLPKHDLLIEKLPTPNGNVSIIHTQKGSVASVPHASMMDCKPKRSVFGGKEVRGISGFLNLAFYTKISGLYEEGESSIEAGKFLVNMPSSCGKTSYPNLSKNIKAACVDLSKTTGAKNLVSTTFSICKGKSK